LLGFEGWKGNLISGWSLSSIVTLQTGFPLTPQLSYNPSNNGDTRNPVRPFLNPGFTGPIVLGNPTKWFNPAAFIAPPSTSGFYGNAGRDMFIGPRLATWDFSVLKNTTMRAQLHLQFRAEIFNLLNRANFNTPNLIVFTPPTTTNPTAVSGTAGAITSTSTNKGATGPVRIETAVLALRRSVEPILKALQRVGKEGCCWSIHPVKRW
jgi:hypothetical protein